jgi:hypothetical protein
MDSQAKKKCKIFLKWAKNANCITNAKNQIDINKKNAIKQKKDQEKIKKLDKTLSEQKSAIITKQIESLLQNSAIDCINGFLNL